MDQIRRYVQTARLASDLAFVRRLPLERVVLYLRVVFGYVKQDELSGRVQRMQEQPWTLDGSTSNESVFRFVSMDWG